MKAISSIQTEIVMIKSGFATINLIFVLLRDSFIAQIHILEMKFLRIKLFKQQMFFNRYTSDSLNSSTSRLLYSHMDKQSTQFHSSHIPIMTLQNAFLLCSYPMMITMTTLLMEDNQSSQLLKQDM